MTRVDLNEAAEWLAGTPPEVTVYVDRRTGECVSVADGFENEFDEPLDLEADHWIALPGSFDRDEWRLMEAFAASRPKPGDRERLLDAIGGRGAFRRFKDAAQAAGLLDDWYACLHEETKKLLREVFAIEGVEFEDRPRRRS